MILLNNVQNPLDGATASSVLANFELAGQPVKEFRAHAGIITGLLAFQSEHFLDETTPKLREIYGRHGDWHAIVEGVMDFPPHLPEKIRELWTHNSEKAHANGVVLPPQVFAEAVVDQNLIR